MSRQPGDQDNMAQLQRAAQVIEGRKKTRIGMRMLLLLLALGGAVWAYYEFGVVIPDERVQVSLLRVTDGDTLLVLDPDDREMKVRLIGVNAPELGTAASFASALYTAELLEKAGIKIQPPTATTQAFDEQPPIPVAAPAPEGNGAQRSERSRGERGNRRPRGDATTQPSNSSEAQ